MASGLPVIAFGAAGALETVIDGQTGVFFKSQTVESLMQAVISVERGDVRFEEEKLRARAAQFSKARFQQRFSMCVDETLRRRAVRSAPARAAKRPALGGLPRSLGIGADGAS